MITDKATVPIRHVCNFLLPNLVLLLRLSALKLICCHDHCPYEELSWIWQVMAVSSVIGPISQLASRRCWSVANIWFVPDILIVFFHFFTLQKLCFGLACTAFLIVFDLWSFDLTSRGLLPSLLSSVCDISMWFDHSAVRICDLKILSLTSPIFAYSCSYPVIWTSSLSAVSCDLRWPDLAHGCASVQLFLYMRHCQTWELISEVEQQPLAQTLLLFLHPTSSWSVCAIFSLQPHECILAQMFCNSSAAFLQALFTIPPDQQQRHPCFFLQSLWTVGPASTHLDPSTPKQLAVGPAHHHKPTLPFISHFVIHIVFRALSFLIPISFLCLCIWNGESRGVKKKEKDERQ